MSTTPTLWFLALLPVATLFLLVLVGRLKTTWSALIALAVGLAVASTAFDAPASTIAVGGGKGLWLGLWILCVVAPALLLYRLASHAGIERLGETFLRYLPLRADRTLLLAWIFPSFIQGVAGFGTPIAICAPLLLMLGHSKVRAVVLPLVGYHWSVTFGSMGSSFYMASLTAGFGVGTQESLALRAGLLLAVNVLVAGVLVLLLDGGWGRLREGAGLLLTAGPVMAASLVIVATAVPAVASLAAGTAGLLVLAGKRAFTRDLAPREGDALAPAAGAAPAVPPASVDTKPALVLAPYGYLLLVVLPVFLIPPAREFVTERFLLAPTFPSTATGLGWVNEAVDGYLPIPALGHPGFYVTLACVLGWLTYRAAGLWEGVETRGLVGSWLRGLRKSAPTILVLGMLAMILVDSGIIIVLATGAAEQAGTLYVYLSPLVGAVGSFMTGSSTASNALFAALQGEVARQIAVEPEALVAAQTAGANVGNSIAPVVVLIGASAVDALDRTAEITRMCLLPVVVLLLTVIAGVTVAGALLP